MATLCTFCIGSLQPEVVVLFVHYNTINSDSIWVEFFTPRYLLTGSMYVILKHKIL